MTLVSGQVSSELQLVRPQHENINISIEISILFDSLIAAKAPPKSLQIRNVNISYGISILFDNRR